MLCSYIFTFTVSLSHIVSHHTRDTGNQLTSLSEFKNLGVIFDCNLGFKQHHASSISSDAYKSLGDFYCKFLNIFWTIQYSSPFTMPTSWAIWNMLVSWYLLYASDFLPLDCIHRRDNICKKVDCLFFFQRMSFLAPKLSARYDTRFQIPFARTLWHVYQYTYTLS